MSKDIIYREDAINLLWYFQDECCSAVVGDFEKLPSADRPQGEWIYCEEDDSHLPEDGRYGIFKCSNCGSKQSYPISEGSGRVYGDNYCPSCGARMKGADDYEQAIEQMEHDMLYEPTYNEDDGSM